MQRTPMRERIVRSRLERIIAWMMPAGRVGGGPMRSVARELEELLPSREI